MAIVLVFVFTLFAVFLVSLPAFLILKFIWPKTAKRTLPYWGAGIVGFACGMVLSFNRPTELQLEFPDDRIRVADRTAAQSALLEKAGWLRMMQHLVEGVQHGTTGMVLAIAALYMLERQTRERKPSRLETKSNQDAAAFAKDSQPSFGDAENQNIAQNDEVVLKSSFDISDDLLKKKIR